MKKLLIAMLIVCLAFAGFLTWKNYTPGEASVQNGSTASNTMTQEIAPAEIDYDAMYAAYAPDKVVMRVGSDEVTWDKFFYYFSANVGYLNNMSVYYGGDIDWDMIADEETGETLSENMSSVAKENARQLYAFTRFAEENGAEITDEQQAAMAEELKQIIARVCGEGATEEDFNEYLGSLHASRELYDMMERWSYLDESCFIKLYGENGALISDEAAMAYINDNGYAQLNHILFMCMDMTTGEELDEAAQTEKLKQAEALVEELRAVEDTEEMLALYAQRKEELDEDTGKTAYPNGYTVTPDTQFVPEFLDGGYALGDYEISDPIKSAYGYHVMLRLPLNGDSVLDESSGATARILLAEEKYNQEILEYMDSLECEYADDFVPLNVKDFIK